MSESDSQATVLDEDDAARAAPAAPARAPGPAPAPQSWAVLATEEEEEQQPAPAAAAAAADDDDDCIVILSGASSSRPPPAPWPCLLCTCINSPAAARCAACGVLHGAPYAKLPANNFYSSSLVLTPSAALPFLYLGAVNAAEGAWLQGCFTHVVCVMELEPGARHPAQDLGPQRFAHLPVSGSCGRTICPARYAAYHALLPAAFAVINSARSSRGGGARVLVHCQHGISRSAAVAAAYLLAHSDLLPGAPGGSGGGGGGGGAPTGAQALAFLKSRREAVNPAKGLCAALEAYGKVLARRGGGGGGGGGSDCAII